MHMGLPHQRENRYDTIPLESLGLEVMGCPIAKPPFTGRTIANLRVCSEVFYNRKNRDIGPNLPIAL